MPSVTEITVRYAETDCMGVTHHAVYPVWFEVARTDYIKNAAVSYAEMERRGVTGYHASTASRRATTIRWR